MPQIAEAVNGETVLVFNALLDSREGLPRTGSMGVELEGLDRKSVV